MANSGAASRQVLNNQQFLMPQWTHPEVLYWMSDWKLLRDAAAGEKEVKYERQTYLPKFEGMDDDEYETYLLMSTYYNFTGRTLEALKGTIFRRKTRLKGMADRHLEALETVSRQSTSLTVYAKFVAREMLNVGRVGVLVDMPQEVTTEPEPYLCTYLAENILDWEEQKIETKGRSVLSRVVLREFHLQKAAPQAAVKSRAPNVPTSPNGGSGATRQYFAAYRVLSLEYRPGYLKPVYVQRYYSAPDSHADITDEYFQYEVVPLVRGEPLDYIPFQFFGSLAGGPGIERPPMIDIARLNVSHYRSYAHLEHGRFYTGFPVYYVEVGQGQEGGGEYEIGPSRVWETPTGSKPGIIEFNGHGLKFLENACAQKEAQAASLGGRMIGVTTNSTTESNDTLKMKDRNEQSILLDMSHMLDAGFTSVIRWWLIMRGETPADVKKVEVVFNKDFMLDSASSREYRAIHAMYKDGIIPVEVLHDYLKAHEVVPDDMELEDFVALLESKDSFPNQPDAEARAAGFPSMQAKINHEQWQEENDLKAEAQDAQIEATKLAAKNPPPVAPGMPPHAPGAPPPHGFQPGSPPSSGKKPGPVPKPAPAKTGNNGGK